MSQNAELQKVKERIRAFSARTVDRGCTEAEMKHAMDKVGQLLEQYNLNMSEVDLRDEPCVEQFVATGSKQATPASWAAVAIAGFCGVKVWHRKSSATGYNYHFFGMESDVEMAVYLYKLIENAIETETAAFKKTSDWLNAYPRKSATISFYRGMTKRISARLHEMKAANDLQATVRAQDQQKLIGSNVTSLVIIKDRLVDDAMKAKKGWLPKNGRGSSRITNKSAYGSGKDAGSRVNLSRPLSGSNGGGQRLIGSN